MTSSPPESPAAVPHRCGFVTLVGRPNAGKSTLLNQVLGQKLSIVSAKPQTTRNRLIGIHTEPGLQVILVDTPGIHVARSRLNKAMVQAAVTSLGDVDAVCWVIDLVPVTAAARKGRAPLSRGEQALARMIAQANPPALTVALNKADLVKRSWILPVIQAVSALLPDAQIVPISALKGLGIPELMQQWRAALPEGPAVFPADQVTDAPERFIVAELIREKLFHLTQQEVPYSTAVEIELFDEEQRDTERPRVHIMARIFVERDSQKGIVIGKGGAMLKQVGTLARHEIERLLGASVFLELHVSVRPKWTSSGRALREFGYE
ncbi:MAG: GTPase Era [Oligoflexia bacterium]|nr:GTPase Era [Oligoflexia bacterium]